MKSPGHALRSQENREPNSPFKGSSAKKSPKETIYVTSIPIQQLSDASTKSGKLPHDWE